MWRNGRHVLLHPGYVLGYRNALRQAREDLADMHEKHLREHAALRAELDAAVADLNELRAAVWARHQAEATVDNLRAVQRAVDEMRDSPVTLH
jgi:hypothetical protein